MLRSVIDRLRLLRDLWRRRMAMWRWDRINDTNGSFVDRVVFVRWDAKLGDTVVLSWVLRELKRQRPDLEIVVVTVAEYEDLFRRGYGIESIFLTGRRHGWQELRQIAKELSRSRYVVHLGEIWRPRDLFFVRQINPQHVVGLDDALKMIDIKLGQRTQGQHFSEKLVPWLEQLGVDTSDRSYWVPRNADAAAEVDKWWPDGDVVGFCPFGASKKRQLSVRQIEFILDAIIEDRQRAVLVIAQLDKMHELRHALKNRPWFTQLIFHSTSDVTQLCEQTARCLAVISVDTAIVHIASGLKKPLLALYGDEGPQSANFKSWHPNNPRAIYRFIAFGATGFNAREQCEVLTDSKRLFER